MQLASEGISSPDGVGSGGVQLVPVAPHLAVHINEKHLLVPDSVSDCKCAVIDNVCDFSWTNCEWLQNTSGENQYFVQPRAPRGAEQRPKERGSDVQNHIRASGGYGKKVTEEKESCAEDQTTAVVKLQGILSENIKDGGNVEKDARLLELVRDEATDEAIERGWTTVLHRDEAKSGTEQGWTTGRHKDEAMDTHPYIQAVLHRDEAKNGTEQGWTTGLHRDEAIDGAIERGVTTVPHRERRKYRRTTHKDPTCTDRPGLRGPKATGTLGARDWARESAGMATR